MGMQLVKLGFLGSWISSTPALSFSLRALHWRFHHLFPCGRLPNLLWVPGPDPLQLLQGYLNCVSSFGPDQWDSKLLEQLVSRVLRFT